jgi:hypothetical protein
VGFMRDQAPRLLREKWPDAVTLAEEIFAIWTSEKPVKIDGPLEVTNDTGKPSITINQGDAGDVAITINNNPVPVPPDPGLPDNVNIVENTYITNIYGDGTTEGFPEPPVPPPGPEVPQPGTGENPIVAEGGGGGFPGKVISQTSGAVYSVAVYEQGLSESPTTREVTQLQIHEDATIPADTWTIVGTVGTGANVSRFMQVPVWLEDLA